MVNYDLTYKTYGNQAILIDWPPRIEKEILQDILSFQNVLKDQKIRTSVVAYHSLMVVFKQPIRNFELWVNQFREKYNERLEHSNRKSRIWEVPVCYDLEFGLDLSEVSETLEVSVNEIVRLHSKEPYLVYFIGFQPGFLYLGGLTSKLELPRREVPRISVAQGSVGIAGLQTGVYPSDTSGGWNIIGRSPISFFDVDRRNPCFASSGDYIQFVPISKSQFNEELNAKTATENPKYRWAE